MGENSIVSILILLLLFVGLPSLLKRLGQHTSSDKDAERPHGQEGEAMHEEVVHDYLADPPARQDLECTTKESFSNRPIHPKWF